MGNKWNLPDLADFEALLQKGSVTEEDTTKVQAALQKLPKKSESEQRITGLTLWFHEAQKRAKADGTEVGERLRLTLALVQALTLLISFLLGIGLMAGLIERVGLTEGKAYNVWKLIAIPIGGQGVFLLFALLSWLILRKNSRKMTLPEEVASQLIKTLAGRAGARGWNELYKAGSGYREILSWRIARIAQWGAVAFNLGIVLGFLAILLFLEINFFWATTLEDFGHPQLLKVSQFLASPWSWAKPDWCPTAEQLTLTQLQIGQLNPDGEAHFWFPFLLLSFLIWGMLPRLITALFCHRMEGLSLRKLTFMEKRHRELWRQLSPRAQTARTTPTYETSQDGVILIDVGGTDATTEELRPFLLQSLRVNPTKRFTASVMNGDEKELALAALKKAQRGVVMLVDSWNLSPKQLSTLHQNIRDVANDCQILYLVLGLPKAGVTQAPTPTEMQEWEHYITDLNDADTEVIAYRC